MTKESYIPKASIGEYCDGLNLCSVRKDDAGMVKIGLKDLFGNITEQFLDSIINLDTYNEKPIIRVYSSGHIFFDETREKVFLVTTQKDGKTQHQFTGGSPMEEENKEVINKDDGVYKINIQKVRANARIRTKNRTGVQVTEEYNEKPLVDWVLMEGEENGEGFYKLVCLMHFIVKKYEGTLSFTGIENTIGGEWYQIDNLPDMTNIAPNIFIVSKSARDFLQN